MTKDDPARALLLRYRTIGLKPPAWATSFRPTIPFIGRHYKRRRGILVYASAENHTQYVLDPDAIPPFMKDDRVLNRHRTAFSVDGRFFPFVHMQPFDDGSLLVALNYYMAYHHAHRVTAEDPESLLEQIVAANFSKFSMTGPVNVDVAGNLVALRESFAYVSADLAELLPSVIIMPRSIWRHPQVKKMIRLEAPDARVVPLPQFNPRVAHIHLRRHAAAAGELRDRLRGSTIASWIDRVPRYAPGSFYRFLVELV